MFFQERIISIKERDKVLEIGPGATPHKRSDVFLEKAFETEEELIAQSGHVGTLETNKPIVYYKGNTFPFKDKEFDYVICSHVLEHVDDVEQFLSEIMRIGKRGYLEFPTIYYDYLHNIEEHQNMLLVKKGKVFWCKKEETPIPQLTDFTNFFRSLQHNNYRFQKEINSLWHQGFEWDSTIKCVKTNDWKDLTYSKDEINSLIKPIAFPNTNNLPIGVKLAFKQLLLALKNKINRKK